MAKENLERRLHTQVSEAEAVAVKAAADAEGRAVSAWLRRAALRALPMATAGIDPRDGLALVGESGPQAEIKQIPQRRFDWSDGCRHPINRRIGDSCGACGNKVK